MLAVSCPQSRTLPCRFVFLELVQPFAGFQTHAGYDLPFDPFNRGVFHGGARRHDFHHSHNHGCFADFLPFWDWLCGTDLKYKEYWEANKALATYPM